MHCRMQKRDEHRALRAEGIRCPLDGWSSIGRVNPLRWCSSGGFEFPLVCNYQDADHGTCIACIGMQRAPDQIERPKFRRPISIMRPQSLYLGGEHDSDSLETSHAWPVYFVNSAYAIWDNLSLSRALLKVGF